ncbi:N-acetylmuramoyl-L-alanine amidase [Gordonia sp. TBRC 11910]|uniref:N-acetylmuramoyl-L-alanine amidase n=2 Tax=Gordonia asplenii TaxID=2725283 RepID=A0A848KUU4_9ACTN|nr:N-acetylmuramoyl-L-alanine amidase [Gordonia asplenii]
MGKTIFLDPGHQGGAAGHSLSKQVPDGRGGTKDCQTTGATGVNGVTEHRINWDVAQLVKAGLESQGARVVLSRADDTGWGGCVDERAAAASRSGAAVAVSLHADSTSAGSDATNRGFHMIVPTLPLPSSAAQLAQSGGGRKASSMMRDSFKKAGFAPANYAGVVDGIQTRSDIAAVNLTTVPAVFIEMGNLSNPTEAAALSGKVGQLKYATAITDGILAYAAGAGVSGSPLLSTGSLSANPSDSPTTPNTDVDVEGLSGVIPFVTKAVETRNPSALLALILGPGQDVGSQVLKAMLSVIYSLFGGKLPVG